MIPLTSSKKRKKKTNLKRNKNGKQNTEKKKMNPNWRRTWMKKEAKKTEVVETRNDEG